MAVLPNLKQVVAGKLGQSFKKFVGGIGKGSVGALPNMSDFAKLGGGAKGGMANLSFPLDVTSGPENGNHGHYVVFFVNEQVNAKIGFSVIKDKELNPIYGDYGGGGRDRTDDIMLAKHTLSQLSYIPVILFTSQTGRSTRIRT